MLEFCLANAYQRRLSLAKINRLAKIVNEFLEALYAEAELMEQQRKKPQSL
jgi:hypothetical protein